jgi:hypothetical protein
VRGFASRSTRGWGFSRMRSRPERSASRVGSAIPRDDAEPPRTGKARSASRSQSPRSLVPVRVKGAKSGHPPPRSVAGSRWLAESRRVARPERRALAARPRRPSGGSWWPAPRAPGPSRPTGGPPSAARDRPVPKMACHFSRRSGSGAATLAIGRGRRGRRARAGRPRTGDDGAQGSASRRGRGTGRHERGQVPAGLPSRRRPSRRRSRPETGRRSSPRRRSSPKRPVAGYRNGPDGALPFAPRREAEGRSAGRPRHRHGAAVRRPLRLPPRAPAERDRRGSDRSRDPDRPRRTP